MSWKPYGIFNHEACNLRERETYDNSEAGHAPWAGSSFSGRPHVHKTETVGSSACGCSLAALPTKSQTRIRVAYQEGITTEEEHCAVPITDHLQQLATSGGVYLASEESDSDLNDVEKRDIELVQCLPMNSGDVLLLINHQRLIGFERYTHNQMMSKPFPRAIKKLCVWKGGSGGKKCVIERWSLMIRMKHLRDILACDRVSVLNSLSYCSEARV